MNNDNTCDQCDTCGEYDFLKSHVCPPQWEIWQLEEGEERWAALIDSYGDYTIEGGSEAQVCVAKLGSDEVEWYAVNGESVPSYTATKRDAPCPSSPE